MVVALVGAAGGLVTLDILRFFDKTGRYRGKGKSFAFARAFVREKHQLPPDRIGYFR